MFKLKIPERARAYIFLGLIAVGLVLLFTWGQLTFFTWEQLSKPTMGVKTTSAARSRGYLHKRDRYAKNYFKKEKPKGFFQSIKAAYRQQERRRYIEKLKKIAKKVASDKERAEINLFLAQYYINEENDEQSAKEYYDRALLLNPGKIIKDPDLDWQEQLFNSTQMIQDFSSRSLLEIGRFYRSQRKPRLASKSFIRVIKNYGKNPRFQKVPQVRRDTHSALEELVVLRARRGEVFPPYKYESTDPTQELQRLVKDILNDMLRNRPKKLIPFIPAAGVESGIEPGLKNIPGQESEHYSRAAMIYQLQKKQGPHYEQLFGWLKRNKVRAQDIKYWISNIEPNLYQVNIIYKYKEKNYAQKLYFQIIDSNWYLVFVSLD